MVEECLRRHVALGSGPILYLHLLLQVHDLLYRLVLSQLLWLSVLIYFDLRQSKINKQARVRLRVVQEVGRLDIPMDDTAI